MLPARFFSPRILVSTALAGVLVLPVALNAQTSAAPETIPPAAVASRLTQRIDENSRITLSGTVHPLARAANDRGAAPDDMRLDRIQIVLKRSNTQESALKQLIQEMHTPGSASYHKWLTPDQFGQQFGPSDADVATLEAWLQGHGFGSMKLNPGRQTLEFSGSAGQFRSTFHAEIHTYQVNGETHYGNATDPQIPAALAPVFGGFSSLNNFRVRRQSKLLGKAAYDPATNRATPVGTTPQWTTSNTGIPNLILAPADFAVQYDLNPLYAAKTTGSGETIAIVNDSNIDPVLVSNFRTLFSLPPSAPNVIIDGNDPGIDGINNPDGPNYDSIEAYLDVEWSGAVAPGATIDLVLGADTALESGLILAAEHAVYGNVAPILSLSFGACELSLGSGNVFLSQLWEQAAAQGITVLVSTGDSGSASCDDPDTQYYAVGGQQVSGFASTPYNVAVGGTDFYYTSYNSGSLSTVTSQLGQYWNLTPSNSTPTVSLNAPVPEQAWNDSQYGLDIFTYPSGETTIAAGGGGASTAGLPTGVLQTTYGPYPKPTWQTGAGIPADGSRDLPDISLFAADGINASYTPICASDGDCQPVASGGTTQITGVGGTSVAAPSFAGIMALVNQKYGPQGQADFVLYPLAAQFPTAFHDVVNGTNSVPCNVATSGAGEPAVDCIAVANPETITDPTYGEAVEGQIGNTIAKTPEFNAAAGYDLATGLGSVDANVLVTDWGNVKFASSSVTLTPSETTFAHGATITVSGSVTPTGSTPPAGSVALMTDSTTPLQAGQTTFAVSGGAYSGSVNYLPGGTYNIWGQYSGDGSNAASASAKTQITVTPEASSLAFYALNSASGQSGTAISLAGAVVPYGTQLILSGEAVPTTYYTTCLTTVAPPASCNTALYGVPTGSVTFTDGGTTLNIAPVNAEGDAEFNAPFAIGSHSVAANYSGDASYSASSAAAIAFTVAKATPQIALTTPVTGLGGILQAGQAATFTIQVENTNNLETLEDYSVGGYVPVAAPTGSVTIAGLPSGVPTTATLAGSVDAGTTFVEGVAAITAPSNTPAGTYGVTIVYSGDANYNATSATGTLTIAGASSALATTTTVASTSATTSISAGVGLSVTVAAAAGQAAPTGDVVFTASVLTASEGAQTEEIGEAALVTGPANTSTAFFTADTQNLQPGSNPITVLYLGSSTYQPSSGVVTITSGPSFTLAGAAVTATPGTAATSAITITPSGGFTGSVALACAVVSGPSGAADIPTCSVSAPAAITGAAAVTATLTINSTAATIANLDNPLNRIFTAGGGITLAAFLFFGLPDRRRRWRSLPGLLIFAAIAVAATGCSNNAGSSSSTTNSADGTTAGVYTVNVTGTGTTTSANSTNPGPVTQTVAVAVTIN